MLGRMDLRNAFTIGRIRGVAIQVHWSWLLVFVLIAWSLAGVVYADEKPEWSDNQLWTAGLISSLLFFVSVLLHELSHTFVALHYGMSVPAITLFVFGGVSQMAGEMRSPRQEFFIAVVGPLASWGLAIAFGALWVAFRSEGVSVVFGYLAAVNFLLGAFNLLPGFPLDGGRVFRSIVWARVHDLTRATRIASLVGIAIAWLLIGLGAVSVLAFGGLGGLWYVLIGLFLKNASESAYAQVLLERALKGVTAGDVMRPPPAAVPETWSLQELAEERVLGQAERVFFTESLGRISGLITVTDLTRVPRERWGETTVRAAMVPSEQVHTVEPGVSVLEAMRLMQEHDVNQLPVLDEGRLVGLLTRGDVLQRLELNTLVGNFEPPRLTGGSSRK
jgi:Zn-dependent protease